MKLYRVTALFIGLVAAFLLPMLLNVDTGERTETPESVTRQVRYSFTISNVSDELVSNVTFSTFAPLQETPFQRLERIESNERFVTTTDELGNQQLRFVIDGIPPYGQRTIVVKAALTLWSSGRPGVTTLPEQASISVSDDLGRELARITPQIDALSGQSSALTWVRSANEWVHNNLVDTGYLAEDRGAYYALTRQEGDCTEFMHALVAILRARNTQALPVAGFRVNGQSSVLKAMDFHNWASVKIGQQWHVADPFNNVFNDDSENYIVFRQLTGASGHAEHSSRFFEHDPRVKVAMN